MTCLDTSALVKHFVAETGSGEALVKVELGAEILSSARDLIQRHGLRAFDAIHLASALGLQTAANEPVSFVASDQRLLRAAADERLATVNPETPRGR